MEPIQPVTIQMEATHVDVKLDMKRSMEAVLVRSYFCARQSSHQQLG